MNSTEAELAKRIYTEGAQKLFEGVFNWASDNFDALLLPSSYAFDGTDVFISDLGTVLKRVALAGKTNADGVLDATDPTFSAVPVGTVGSLVIAKNTGADGTSPLFLFDDTVIGLPYPASGGDIILRWDDGVDKILRVPTTL
jgi:hypothetical protein